MSRFTMSTRSLKSLEGVHPELVKVVKRALELSRLDFVVTEGVRTLQKQTQLLAAGASQTLRSRHLTGHAVDLAALVAGKVRWDYPLYGQLAITMKAAAAELKVSIEWGGDWKSIQDKPHFELRPEWAANLTECQMLTELRRRHDAKEDAFTA